MAESQNPGRGLDDAVLDLAFRHGFDARERFADRPFDEVESYLRSSWEGMAPPSGWDRVRDVIRNGYENFKGAGFGESVELPPEALDRFPERNADGNFLSGRPNRELEPAFEDGTTDEPAGGTGRRPPGADQLPEADLGLDDGGDERL